jgi:hypothetical protein
MSQRTHDRALVIEYGRAGSPTMFELYSDLRLAREERDRFRAECDDDTVTYRLFKLTEVDE